MAMRRIAILALVGTAFAHTGGMSGEMDGSSTTTASTQSSDGVTSGTSTPPTSITNLSTTTTDAVSGVPTSSKVDNTYGWSSSVDNYSSETITVVANSSVTASSSLVTDTTHESPVTKTHTATTTKTEGVGSAGESSMPNANATTTATATGKPISGNGVVNSVSVGLFFASVALTALLQL